MLAIETATHAVGVGLADETGVIAATEILQGRRHAESLVVAIDSLLQVVGRTYADVTAVAVDVGPGLFTGLRVGVAAAKAFALALDAPIVTATSLEILAFDAADWLRTGDRIVGLVDARRKQMYAQHFAVVAGPDGMRVEAVGAATVLSPESVRQGLSVVHAANVANTANAANTLHSATVVVGDGAARYPDAVSGLSGVAVRPSASPSVGALLRLCGGRPGGVADAVEPVYLRAPDAEINWIAR